MVPRCYGIEYSEKAYSITTQTRKMLGALEKTRSFSKPPRSYFLYVGTPRRVTKLFRIEEENMRCGEIQIGGNSFRKIRHAFRKIIIFLTNITNFRWKTVTFRKKGCHACEKRRAYTRKVDNLYILSFGIHVFALVWCFRCSQMVRMRPSAKVNMNEQHISRGLSHTEPKY